MDTAPPIPAEEQPARLITKSKLADLLGVSARTVSTYISAGYLPVPHRLGRDAAWPVTLLEKSLSERAEPQVPDDIRARLQDCLDRAEAEGATVGSGESRRARLAAGLLVDEEANVAADWRPQLHARNAELRKSAREHDAEAKDYHWSSDERRQLQKFSADLREEFAEAFFARAVGRRGVDERDAEVGGGREEESCLVVGWEGEVAGVFEPGVAAELDGTEADGAHDETGTTKIARLQRHAGSLPAR